MKRTKAPNFVRKTSTRSSRDAHTPSPSSQRARVQLLPRYNVDEPELQCFASPHLVVLCFKDLRPLTSQHVSPNRLVLLQLVTEQTFPWRIQTSGRNGPRKRSWT